MLSILKGWALGLEFGALTHKGKPQNLVGNALDNKNFVPIFVGLGDFGRVIFRPRLPSILREWALHLDRTNFLRLLFVAMVQKKKRK